ncbi:IEC3 subunit of the Ino80 complex, chromatin re-modelling-domain-containing protein [Halenospora varia]|nr:IEC3 subunit of the Ino80 complex, chromatin re-modelling-domain-containing protein [Halenospora varia]
MRQSNEWYVKEQQAEEHLKRLAIQNDQLLDLLLDVNNSAQIPSEKRIDMSADVPSLSAVPPLVSNEDLARAAQLDTPEGQAIYREIRSMLEEKTAMVVAARNGPKPPKPLSLVVATVPHLTLGNPLVSPDLLKTLEPPEGHTAPITYLTPDHIDEYLDELDGQLGNGHPVPHPSPPGHHDLALRNPNSVYNWLRKNEPKVFLQDNEGSEKSLGKPGALRGAGKRASIPAPSKPDALEFVEEDGIGYDASLAGPSATKGKRKREDGDDGAYHPKANRVDETGVKKAKRPYNRKKKPEGAEGSPAVTTSGRKKKAKAASPAPDAPPFGPL